MFALGYSKEKIIETFYTTNKFTYDSTNKNWVTDFDPENFKRPIKLSFDLIDAKNSKKVLSKGEKLNIVIARKLFEKGLKTICVANEYLIGRYLAKEVKDKNGEIIVGAGFDITEEQLSKIINQEERNLFVANIDPINKGIYS